MKHLAKAGLLATLTTLAIHAGSAAAGPASLPAYGADPGQTSVSGLSSGAFMAVQLQVAYSGSITGSGIIAGGPYYCAANNILFTGICMGQVPFVPPNPALMASAARNFSATGLIDPVDNLTNRRVYVFGGTSDTIVRQQAVDATADFFQQVGIGKENLQYVKDVPAGHAVITAKNGNDCPANAEPYISHCTVNGKGYDQAGAILSHIYGPLNPPVSTPTGKTVSFNQRAYAAADTAMADTGFLYIPEACNASGSRCKVHVALHGCMQSAESVGDQFYTKTGYNNWADSNRILVLYPQVNKSSLPYNPKGCWDWWGYTGMHYADRQSPQMNAIKAMINRLTEQPAR